MKIKNKIRLILSLSTLILFGGCTDLEYNNLGGIIPEGSGDSEAFLLSAYGAAREFANERTIFGLTEHPSDVLIGPTRGGDWFDGGVFQQMHLHQWHPDHIFIITAWKSLNDGVFKATQAIAGNGVTPQITAEAKTIRAYYLFHILDFWGITAFREAAQGLESDPLVRNSAESVNWIIEDLESALSDLPEASSKNVANKNTARAILCKLYLNKAVYEADSKGGGTFDFNPQDMDKVISYATDIEASGQYSLTPGVVGYFQNFAEANDEQSTELILSVPKEVIGGFKQKWNCTLHWNMRPPGWSGFATLSDFYDTFEEGDSRLGGAYNSDTNPYTEVSGTDAGFLVGQQTYADGTIILARDGVTPVDFSREVDLKVNGEVEGIRVLKYIPDFRGGVDNADDANNSMVLLRYGEVVMNKAEAMFRKGDVAEAEEVVNGLREIRFEKPAPLELTLESLLEERGRELYWEGWRRHDLIRFGKFLDEWQEKPATDSDKVLFPIPSTALLANPALQQNSGY